jgi:hypothetical protein
MVDAVANRAQPGAGAESPEQRVDEPEGQQIEPARQHELAPGVNGISDLAPARDQANETVDSSDRRS